VNADERARAAAALDLWWTPAPWTPPGRTWDQSQLEEMHAALEAPDVDAALRAVGADPGTWLSEPGQDDQNRALMAELRQRLGRGPGSEAAR
jgi:hypothetical protein